MARDVLDTVVAAETPEGIMLELRPAGLSARFYAFAIDWMIRIVIAYVALMATLFMGGFGQGFWLLLYFLLEWFYPVVFAAILSTTVYVIVDLEFPRVGFIRVDGADRILADLRESMQ